MNQPRPDFASPPGPSPAKERSAAQLRALRKELLLVRADLERAELGASVAELRGTVARLGWLRFAIPALIPALIGVATGLGVRAKGAGGIFGRHPLLGTLFRSLFGTLLSSLPGLLASLFTAGPDVQTGAWANAQAKPAARWTGVAFAAWETWRTWRQVRRDRRQAGEPPSVDEQEMLRK